MYSNIHSRYVIITRRNNVFAMKCFLYKNHDFVFELSFNAESVKLYVEWAADLQDDSDIHFFMDSVDLIGSRLRLEIANLYDVPPFSLLIRQTRGYCKKNGELLVLTLSCAFSDQWGNIVLENEVEKVKSHIIYDRETVPLPGDWRALVHVRNVSRQKLRLAEQKKIRADIQFSKR